MIYDLPQIDGIDFDEGLFHEKIAEIKLSMQTFDINNPYWTNSLRICMFNLVTK